MNVCNIPSKMCNISDSIEIKSVRYREIFNVSVLKVINGLKRRKSCGAENW